MNIDLRPIDRHFADFMAAGSGGNSPEIRLLGALLSHAVGRGHICLCLEDVASKELRVDGRPVALPDEETLAAALMSSAVAGTPGEFRPMMLDASGRLYLHRYWKYEHDLAAAILEMSAGKPEKICEEKLADSIRRLFPRNSTAETDWQAAAALAAVRKHFCVISGGPGTGKTSTVVKILALLLELHDGEHLRIALAAPTGKAAARLGESIRVTKNTLACRDSIKEMIPETVATIHRLLGSTGTAGRFIHSPVNRLPFDTVIVDEASMVSLPLMAQMVTAMKAGSRLILLGDRNQLSSVEAGAVMGDLCGAETELFSKEFIDSFKRISGVTLPLPPVETTAMSLTDSMVILKKNYRFKDSSGIARLGAALNEGNSTSALELFGDPAFPDISWHDAPGPESLRKAISPHIVEGYGHYLSAATPEEALTRFDSFRVLCAVREGPYGVTELNRHIEEILAGSGLIDARGRWYRGRPVTITVNDYNLRLFNGDTGILFPDPLDGQLRAYFPKPDGGTRKISPVRLPTHETAYATTVHKSQGSEFDSVLMLLPGHDSPAVTRELLYTGITRAKIRLRVWGDRDHFLSGAKRMTGRRSGLRDALWGCFEEKKNPLQHSAETGS